MTCYYMLGPPISIDVLDQPELLLHTGHSLLQLAGNAGIRLLYL